MTWGTLSLFYPYFKDLDIDWNAQLPLALRAAAKATDLIQQKHVLSELIAKLHDDHSFIVHPSIATDGVIPMKMRRFGDQCIVVARDAKYLPDLKIGDEIAAIDGMRFSELYDRVSRDVSAATPGWLDVATEFLIVSGEPNKTRTMHVRSASGAERDISITTVPGKEVALTVREARPKTGDQVAPGVIYLDLDEMDDAALDKAMPSLAKATAVIMDLRGYLKKAAYTALAHFASGPVPGPKLQIPLVRDLGPHKLVDVTAVSVRSALQPHLTAKLFLLVGGETASSPESMIQIVRNGKLGLLVGEPTGGTNGNANRFEVAGGFTVRFTGMRAVMDDGRVVQGHGFQPDIVVHPTVEGVRAGRDEILDAAIGAATRH